MGGTICITKSNDVERKLKKFREKLMELDEAKFGKDYVKKEKKKKRGSRYSDAALVEMLMRVGYEHAMKDMERELFHISAKKRQTRDKDVVIDMILRSLKRSGGSSQKLWEEGLI